MPKGSVLVFVGSMWHGGGANRTGERRVGIAMNYCAGFLRQQENQQLGLASGPGGPVPAAPPGARRLLRLQRAHRPHRQAPPGLGGPRRRDQGADMIWDHIRATTEHRRPGAPHDRGAAKTTRGNVPTRPGRRGDQPVPRRWSVGGPWASASRGFDGIGTRVRPGRLRGTRRGLTLGAGGAGAAASDGFRLSTPARPTRGRIPTSIRPPGRSRWARGRRSRRHALHARAPRSSRPRTRCPASAKFTGSNGGATSPGVTATQITLATRTFPTNPNLQLAEAEAREAGVALPQVTEQVAKVFINYFNKVFDLYGRHVVFEPLQHHRRLDRRGPG